VGTWSAKRTVSFLAGLIVTFLATQSIIGVFDMEYFSDHMIQHLLLIMVAAPLFALSARSISPTTPVLRAFAISSTGNS